ncbi:MAG: SDR family oxidoreductase [Variibacter sp.]|nr:SDR family oxidoreductase [Variibacter sp.]
MPSFRPITLVTGASSGIGAALARVFAAHGHELVLAARSEEPLVALADEIAASGAPRPHVIAIDLSRLDSGARLGHELATRALEPSVVVNNAGFGLAGAAHELDRVEQLAMVDLNARAVTDLSLRWIESLQRHRGGLLNVASVAGFLPAPGMAVYYATKAYVLSFTEALHVELKPLGVRVTALCPGPVRTGFQGRAGLKDIQFPRLLEQSVEAVAKAGYEGLAAGKRLVVPGFANKMVTLLPRLLPRSVVLSLADARGRRRRDGAAPAWLRPR